MKKSLVLITLLIPLLFASCTEDKQSNLDNNNDTTAAAEFQYQADRFADLRVLRYQIPGFDKLTSKQKELVYYLTQAGLSGRDIMWDMNYRHNLDIRQALENIIANHTPDTSSAEWKDFMTYTKRVWFSNGIHHHYSMNKINPGFDRDYFESLLEATGTTLQEEAMEAIFNPEKDNKKVNLNPEDDLIFTSAVNFYAPDITQADVEAYYGSKIDKKDLEPVSYGLNSRLEKKDGVVHENVWKIGGMYSDAIEQIVYWLTKASGVAENQAQQEALDLLIEYYNTGDLETWDAYNIAWTEATDGDVDYINGFVEVYNDPLGYRGSYEMIVEINDFEASDRMKVVAENAQWFEDNSTIMDDHKKESVVGVTYKVVNVAGEAGDASPSTPIGVNLPNANWIRAKHGSKSVSLGNIVSAYDNASGKGFLEEFAHDQEEIDRIKAHGELAGKLHTALHEVIGHASGKLNPGVGTPKETLKNYSSTLEEARADLVALYYLLDSKLVDLGLMESLEVGRAEYDGYIRNGLMTQLRRIEPGEVIEEAHMRNRQLVAAWCFEKGKEANVIEWVERDGKTYININDYEELRVLFGQLLREIQRIKSEGDYEAGRSLVENYGVQVDQKIHAEVLERSEKLNIAAYSGFINPVLVPVMDGEQIVDIKVEYPDDFAAQMMEYGRKYSFLAK